MSSTCRVTGSQGWGCDPSPTVAPDPTPPSAGPRPLPLPYSDLSAFGFGSPQIDGNWQSRLPSGAPQGHPSPTQPKRSPSLRLNLISTPVESNPTPVSFFLHTHNTPFLTPPLPVPLWTVNRRHGLPRVSPGVRVRPVLPLSTLHRKNPCRTGSSTVVSRVSRERIRTYSVTPTVQRPGRVVGVSDLGRTQEGKEEG